MMIKRAFPYFLCAVIGFSVLGCKKKDRLTADTFAFNISPSAISLIKGASQPLVAQGFSAAGPVGVSPEWSVSSSLATLNTTIGPSVTVTAGTQLGDVTVTATVNGRQATTQIAIVTQIQATNVFLVYTDAGLPSEAGVNSDIFTGGGTSLAEISTGFTPEGINYQRSTDANTGAFWGVTLDQAAAGLSKDLSAFSAGTLKFAIRLNRALAGGETLRIDVGDTVPTTNSILSSSPNFSGFSASSTDWQEISIQITDIVTTVNLSTIRVPFAIVASSLSSSLTFDVDAVRWER